MKITPWLGLISLFAPAITWAVYAPIPEQEQGKAFTVTVEGGVYHDTNIFGAASSEIDSMVYSIAPKLAFNASVTDQTFVSSSYRLSLDRFSDRPGDRTLDSHALSLRVAHEFKKGTSIDIIEAYSVQRNPESLLAGVTLNTDQSFKHNQLDGRFTTTVGPKTGVVLKYRNTDFNYDNATLAQSLDRGELLLGLEFNHKFLPETTGVGEYRRQSIKYDRAGGSKNKESDFLLVGLDYDPGPQLTLSGRAGVEDRRRDGESDETAPYVELSARYNYTERSFLSGGYVYTLEETSTVALFTDTKVNRFFVNVQHEVAPTVVASGSITYEPSVLQARIGGADADETIVRLGFALTYIARKNFTVSASYDYDDVDSDQPGRNQRRSRVGVNGRFYF